MLPLLVLLAASAALAQQVIPFCSYCECAFPSGDGVDLDCTNTDMKGILLDSYFWYDDYNGTYKVAALRARNSNLQALEKEFPSSTLRLLDVSGNGIERIVEGAFKNLQSLEELDLGNNSLEYLKPEVFKGVYWVGRYQPIRTLKVLRLNDNKIKVLHQNLFEHIKQIEELYLGNNPLGEIGTSTQQALESLRELRILDLRCTGLETLPDGLFSRRFEHLERLDLSENLFLTVPKTLHKLRELEVLFLDENPILELDSTSGFLEPFRTLKILHLSNMPNLESIHAHSLQGLKHLDELHVHDNAFLSHVDERAFHQDEELEPDSPHLRVFDLHGCNVSRMSPGFLPHWRILDSLDVSGNPWVCDCHSQAFIEGVVAARPEEARSVVCASPARYCGRSFLELVEEGAGLACPVDGGIFGSFGSVGLMVVLLNGTLVLICCFFRKRSKRGKYITLRNA